MNTKYKWLAKLGICKTICPKCGAKLNAKGYYYLNCSCCEYHRQESFGHFWSEDVRFRRDIAINRVTHDFKEEIG